MSPWTLEPGCFLSGGVTVGRNARKLWQAVASKPLLKAKYDNLCRPRKKGGRGRGRMVGSCPVLAHLKQHRSCQTDCSHSILNRYCFYPDTGRNWQCDRHGVRNGNRTLQHNTQELSEALPKTKRISSLALSLPRLPPPSPPASSTSTNTHYWGREINSDSSTNYSQSKQTFLYPSWLFTGTFLAYLFCYYSPPPQVLFQQSFTIATLEESSGSPPLPRPTPWRGFSLNPLVSKWLPGWRGFYPQTTFVLPKLSAGKSGTIQCPSGNHWDTNWSFKIRTSGHSPSLIWVNRTLSIRQCLKKQKTKPCHLTERNQRQLNGYRIALGLCFNTGNVAYVAYRDGE